jgi:alpha-L-fucosidase
MHYQPTRESVETHPLPAWFDNAKLGIFVHWGLYSVPGWAPLAGELSEILATGDWAKWFANNPYAEWYMNSWRIEGSPTQRYHAETFGADFSYFDFAHDFNAAAEQWNPDDWASLFQNVHARYAVLTTKHHDGFTLWPSRTPNPFIANYHARRDLVGEFMDAVRGRGLTAALYYSGGLDWTFNDTVIQGMVDLFSRPCRRCRSTSPTPTPTWRELIDRYQTLGPVERHRLPGGHRPAMSSLPSTTTSVPDGVVNDRFTQRRQPGTDAADAAAAIGEGDIAHRGNFFDFRDAGIRGPTPTSGRTSGRACRGIGASRSATTAMRGRTICTSPAENLVRSFVDVVSKNGNLLLNVGPRGGRHASQSFSRPSGCWRLGRMAGGQRRRDLRHAALGSRRGRRQDRCGTPMCASRSGDGNALRHAARHTGRPKRSTIKGLALRRRSVDRAAWRRGAAHLARHRCRRGGDACRRLARVARTCAAHLTRAGISDLAMRLV